MLLFLLLLQGFAPSLLPGLQQLITTLIEKLGNASVSPSHAASEAAEYAADTFQSAANTAANTVKSAARGAGSSHHHTHRVYEEEVTYDDHDNAEVDISGLNSSEYEDHDVKRAVPTTIVDDTVIPGDKTPSPRGASRP